jgi:hypothetical protein
MNRFRFDLADRKDPPADDGQCCDHQCRSHAGHQRNQGVHPAFQRHATELAADPAVCRTARFRHLGGARDASRAVRFLVPVSVYSPGGTGSTAPPDDYLSYLLGQSTHGAQFTDVTRTSVGLGPRLS